MTSKQFEKLRTEILEHENQIMNWKREEYSPEKDRLQNFREVADFLGVKLSEVALTYLLKHIQSISIAIKTGKYDWTWNTESGEGLKQRIADARNYLLLLAACLEEETKTNNKEQPDYMGVWD